jgi:hypothetical protein
MKLKNCSLKVNINKMTMAHACHPSYSRGRSRRLAVPGWPRQSEHLTLFEKQTKKQERAEGVHE